VIFPFYLFIQEQSTLTSAISPKIKQSLNALILSLKFLLQIKLLETIVMAIIVAIPTIAICRFRCVDPGISLDKCVKEILTAQ